MEETSFKENLKLLKEIVLDEERLVTYISISKELCIHVNEAKLLLMEIVKVLKQDHSNIKLNVNYIISGVSDDSRGKVMICSYEELQKLRDTFKVVLFVHVYSVNKVSDLFDKVAFSSINTFEDIPLCLGLIKNDVCLKRSPDEIGVLKSHSQQVVLSTNLQNVPRVLKESKPIKTANKTEHENVYKTKDIEKNTDNHIKQEISSPNNKNQNATKTVDKKTANKKSKGMAGYFNNANGVSATKNCKTVIDTVKDIKEDITENIVEIKTEKDVDMEEEKVVKESSFINTKSKRVNNIIKPNARVDKKRKRVLHVSDSDSDTEENDTFTETCMAVDNESDDEIPPTPTVNTVKITSGIVNPKKRRKVIDKTYTDEDGYILTKKEEVYESCSDNEEERAKKENQTTNKVEIKIEISPKAKNNKVAKKKISPPQKGKQATMTSFFKKV